MFNYNSIKLFSFTLLISLLVFGCSKEEMDDHGHMHGGDDEDVIVTFVSPDNTDKMNGDMLHMHVELRSESTIHNVSVKLLDGTNSDAVVYEFAEHVHEEDGAYDFHHMMELQVTQHSDYKLEVEVTNHDSEVVGEGHVHFHIHHM